MTPIHPKCLKPAETKSELTADAIGQITAATLELNLMAAAVADGAHNLIVGGNWAMGAICGAVGVAMGFIGGANLRGFQKSIRAIRKIKTSEHTR